MYLRPGCIVWAADSASRVPLWIEVDGARYLGYPAAKFNDVDPLPGMTTVTALQVEGGSSVTIQWLESILATIRKTSDFSLLFTTTLVFVSPTDSVEIEAEAESWMGDRRIEWRSYTTPSPTLSKSLIGPHITYNNTLWRMFKVYDDVYGAFLLGLQPRSLRDQGPKPPPYERLSIANVNYQAMGIAVPCRWIQPVSPPQPLALAGVRIAVKDVFRFKGLRTSLCNRAYLATSKPARQTAPIIRKLVDAGAHIIGITKLSSLISREEPSEAIDYHMAFNPRGDGYQSPAGSSNGSAVAVAAYDWVDLAIGTDTSGSGRRPALVNGIFQLRPTHDSICLDGMVKTFSQWDTPCLYGRDLSKFQEVVSLWRSSQVITPRRRPGRKTIIIYPEDYFPVPNQAQMSLIKGFMWDLSRQLGTEISKVSISSMWKEQPPHEAKGQSVEDYLRDTVVYAYYHDFYHSTDQFRARYRAKYQKEPFVTPFNHFRWNLGKQVTDAQHADGMHRLSVYRDWFLRTIMKNEEYRCLLILPVANVEPNYRDMPPPEPSKQEGFDQLFLPPILGAPDIFVPLGESPYHSRISQREEFLPVGVDVAASPGSDAWLIDVIRKCLQSSRRPDRVRTGSRMFA